MKRWTFRIVLCLLLGVVTTAGVAWGCARWSSETILKDDAFVGFGRTTTIGRIVPEYSGQVVTHSWYGLETWVGWPVRCTVLNPSGSLRGWLDDETDEFPFSPILPGFITNTLFYAVIWFGLFFGWPAHRRVIRRWQGYCPKCNYDLRGDLERGCPECGWNRD